MRDRFQIITFYEFKDMTTVGPLVEIRDRVKATMREYSILGTLIIAHEGFNCTVAGLEADIGKFVLALNTILMTELKFKSSFHEEIPFKRVDVKIKPEIVTLKKYVDISKGVGTHVPPSKWNELIGGEDVFVLDARNDYEFNTGTFERAVNPATEKFSDLPEFVEKNLDPSVHKKVAMFCTGGIRCEKFAPYMKGLGFEEVFQLEGGILKYLEIVPIEEQKWNGECYIFDRRVTVDERLRKGKTTDLSQKCEGQ